RRWPAPTAPSWPRPAPPAEPAGRGDLRHHRAGGGAVLAALVLGLGYLGAALTGALLRAGDAVVGLDNGFATDWAVLERLAASSGGRFRLLRGDLRQAADVDAAFAAAGTVDAVYLLAAQAS